MPLFSEKAKYQIRANKLLWMKILKIQKKKKENHEVINISHWVEVIFFVCEDQITITLNLPFALKLKIILKRIHVLVIFY